MQVILLYAEVNALCAFIFAMLWFKIASGHTHETSTRIFCWILACCIILFMADTVAFMTNGGMLLANPTANIVSNVIYFVTIGLMSYLWFLYSESYVVLLAGSGANRLLEAIPMVILAVCALASPFTGWLFYIDGADVYHRGPFHALQLVICFGYLIVASISSMYHGLKANDWDKRQRLLLLATFGVPVIVAGLLQAVLPQIPIICAGCTLSLLYVYNEMRNRLISIDDLTQINGRNQLMRYLANKIEEARDNGGRVCLFMIDVNKFKAINDQFGHIEGDVALTRVANALKRACHGRSAGIFRYGGDEFAVGFDVSSDDDIEFMHWRIVDALEAENDMAEAPYRLSVSIGYAEYESSIKTPNEFIKRADARLYDEKEKVAAPAE